MKQESEQTSVDHTIVRKYYVINNSPHILALWLVMVWGIGIGLQVGWLHTFYAIIFPPYAMVTTCIWIIDLVNRISGV